jgi:hypothetical protein
VIQEPRAKADVALNRTAVVFDGNLDSFVLAPHLASLGHHHLQSEILRCVGSGIALSQTRQPASSGTHNAVSSAVHGHHQKKKPQSVTGAPLSPGAQT